MSKNALVIEDDPDVGQLLIHQLTRWGFNPTHLLGGKDAVAWTQEHQPDLILLDLMLPDMDGYEICRQLKLNRLTNLIPIIMVTARSRSEDMMRGLAVGANSYLTKPFLEGDLHIAIQEVLAWREELHQRGTRKEIQFQIRSHFRYLDELNETLESLFVVSGLSDIQIRHTTMAVREMGSNAIEWGNKRQVDRMVGITLRIDAERITITIRDAGQGFDPQKLPHAAIRENPVAHLDVREQMGMRAGGFGILMARGLVDDLQFNASGNEVRLVKKFAAVAG